jgi:hypothetical protein
MTIKAIFLLKRKPGITHEQFREHYEKSHAELGKKYLGHLMISYTRNYIGEVRGARNQGRKPMDFGYDCITEWVMPDEAALEEVFRIFGIPEIGKVFYDDEERFLDRDAVVTMTIREGDTMNTGTGGGHGTLEHVAKATA